MPQLNNALNRIKIGSKSYLAKKHCVSRAVSLRSSSGLDLTKILQKLVIWRTISMSFKPLPRWQQMQKRIDTYWFWCIAITKKCKPVEIRMNIISRLFQTVKGRSVIETYRKCFSERLTTTRLWKTKRNFFLLPRSKYFVVSSAREVFANQDSLFVLFNDRLDADAATKKCRSLGGHLATVPDNDVKEKFLSALRKEYSPSGKFESKLCTT